MTPWLPNVLSEYPARFLVTIHHNMLGSSWRQTKSEGAFFGREGGRYGGDARVGEAGMVVPGLEDLCYTGIIIFTYVEKFTPFSPFRALPRGQCA